MKLHLPDGRVLVTPCTGCICHEMAAKFGENPDICEGCGCPLHAKKAYEMLADQEAKKP
jgi:hypothetical protein